MTRMAEDTPPRAFKFEGEPPKDDGPKKPRGRPKNVSHIESGLTDFVGIVGYFVSKDDEYLQAHFTKYGANFAHEWAQIAKTNQSVYKYLDGMLTGSQWSQVIMATGMLILPIFAYRELWVPGLPSPWPTQTQVKAFRDGMSGNDA